MKTNFSPRGRRAIALVSLLFSSLLFSSLLFLNSCTKEVPLQPEDEVVEALTPDQLEMKVKLDNAAKLFSQFVNVPEIHKELSQLSYLNNEFDKLSIKNLMDSDIQTKNGKSFNFSNLKKELTKSLSTSKDGGENEGLLEYLISNNCYIYVPYSQDWYPEDQHSYTVAAHPVDNYDVGVGYFTNPNEKNPHTESVMVDEVYAGDHPVVIIMPHDPIVDNPNDGGNDNPTGPGPSYEVKIYEFWCQNKCGGIFEGAVDVNIVRGYPINGTTGTWATQFAFEYPRDLVRAAQAGEERAWKLINTVWDSNWGEEKVQQVMAIFDYDWHASKKTIKGTVKYKGVSGTLSFELPGKKYRANPLLVETEIDRHQFFESQANPGSTDEVRNGMIVRQWGDVKITTHIEIWD